MSTIIFHPEVALEIKASFEWYEAQVTGLGGDYLSELESSYQAIEQLQQHGLNSGNTSGVSCSANFPIQLFITQPIIKFTL